MKEAEIKLLLFSFFSTSLLRQGRIYLSFSISTEVLTIGFPAEEQTFVVDPILLYVSVQHRDSLATGPLDACDAGGQEDGSSVRLLSVSSSHIWDCPDPSVSPCTWSCSISLDPQGPNSKGFPGIPSSRCFISTAPLSLESSANC